VIFVDTNVVMYAVGRAHPAQAEVRQRLLAAEVGTLATSAEVMQELMHAYIPVGRFDDLDRAFKLVNDRMTVWPLGVDELSAARRFADRHPGLGARDLVHLATSLLRGVTEIWTYDRALAAAFGRR
jgi:predicted nucleic acid-binding protein